MAHPLPLSYNWRLPTTLSSIGLVVSIWALRDSATPGWGVVAASLVALWALFLGLVWARTRASLMVDGSGVVVRNVRAFHRVEGSQVRRVRESMTATGPSYRLTLEEAGRSRRVLVPTARLAGGQSSLFAWLLTSAPDAELDKGSRTTLEQLRVRGLVA